MNKNMHVNTEESHSHNALQTVNKYGAWEELDYSSVAGLMKCPSAKKIIY